MSKYISVEIVLKNEAAIMAALKELGYVGEKVAKSASLSGYYGGDRKIEAGGILVKRGKGLSADVGFPKKKDGTYGMVMDNMDERRFLEPFRQVYAKTVAVQSVNRLGYKLFQTKTKSDGTLVLTCRRW